jgi:hypothetical protein
MEGQTGFWPWNFNQMIKCILFLIFSVKNLRKSQWSRSNNSRGKLIHPVRIIFCWWESSGAFKPHAYLPWNVIFPVFHFSNSVPPSLWIRTDEESAGSVPAGNKSFFLSLGTLRLKKYSTPNIRILVDLSKVEWSKQNIMF